MNGRSGSYPNYQNLVFKNCSFTSTEGDSAVFPNGNDTTNFYPENITLSYCWFKDPDTPFSFNSIQNATVEDLYLGGKLVEYTSQVNLTVDESVENFTFTANGKNLTENELPAITYPADTVNAYVGNPLIFYVKAEDPDGDDVTYEEADVSAMEGAEFDAEKGKFSWIPSEEDNGKAYEVTFSAHDYTGQTVSKTVRIRVGEAATDLREYAVSKDAHVQSWDDGERNRTYGERGYITMSLISGDNGVMGEKYDGTGGGKDGKISYLKFDLSEINTFSDQFDKAELELTLIGPRRNTAVNTEDSINIAAVDGEWSEDSITWNTKPGFDEESLIQSEAFNLGENYGDANKNNSTNTDIAVNGTKVTVDITELVRKAISEGKDSLSLALCETGSKEIYFVSREGAAGLLKNASADMVPKLKVNIPVSLAIEGDDAMTILEGQAGESNSFALKGTGPFNVTLTGDTADGKITWNEETCQIMVGEGLGKGTYNLVLNVEDQNGNKKEHSFVLNVEEDQALTEAREALQKAYDAYKDTENENYTDETWEAFAEALQNAENVLGNASASKDELTAAKDALITAYGSLAQKEPEEPEEPDPGEKEYEITEGADSVWTAGEDAGLTIKVDAERDKFVDVTVDGTTVDEDNYTVEDSAMAITFAEEYLASLGEGIHTIRIRFTDGYAQTDLTIKESGKPEEPGDPQDPSGPEDPSDPQDPAGPEDPSDPQDPAGPEDPSDPQDPSDPENPSDPQDPADTKDPSDSGKPSGDSRKDVSTTGKNSGTDNGAPKTGDQSAVPVAAGAVILSLVAVLAVLAVRYNRTKQR